MWHSQEEDLRKEIESTPDKGNCTMEQIKAKPKSVNMNWRYKSSGIQRY